MAPTRQTNCAQVQIKFTIQDQKLIVEISVKMKEDTWCCNANSHQRKLFERRYWHSKQNCYLGAVRDRFRLHQFQDILQYGGQNNGTLRNWGKEFVLPTLKNFRWQHWKFFHLFILCSACISALVLVLSNSLCERIRKMESCPILIGDRSLVHIYLEHLWQKLHIIRCIKCNSF